MFKDITIGLLYESDEWSDHKLARELENAIQEYPPNCAKVSVRMIDMEDACCIDQALECGMLVSRVFASAVFRGHSASLERMERLIEKADEAGIPMLNEGRAHAFEVSKSASSAELARHGISAPHMYGCGKSGQLEAASFGYPCVIKPDCGGRSTHTLIARNPEEAAAFLADAPAKMEFAVQEYIEPERGYITRIEIVGSKVFLAVKRTIGINGLSSYHAGSEYEAYTDCPKAVLSDAVKAAAVLGISFGSFDVIETDRGAFFIDANSVSNVSEDCNELLGCDLMAEHARGIAAYFMSLQND